MPNFVDDNTTLPFPKSDLNPTPSGADTAKYVRAVDWNSVCQASVDLRGVVQSNRSRIVSLEAGLAVQDEGVAAGNAATMNFTGAGVTASVTNGVATVNIPNSGSSLALSIYGRTTNQGPFNPEANWYTFIYDVAERTDVTGYDTTTGTWTCPTTGVYRILWRALIGSSVTSSFWHLGIWKNSADWKRVSEGTVGGVNRDTREASLMEPFVAGDTLQFRGWYNNGNHDGHLYGSGINRLEIQKVG